MKFAHLFWLYLAPLAAILCLFWHFWGARQRRAALGRIAAPRLHDSLAGSLDRNKRAIKAFLFALGVALVTACLARPLLGLKEVQVERAGVDVIIALDVSRSMLAQDAPANRLLAAKNAIIRLIGLPSHDRYGLIIFSGEAGLMAPVTLDHQAVARALDAVSVGMVSKPGTDLAAAIKLASRSYDETHPYGRALLILSDGEQLQGDAVVAAREAWAKGITVFTVGVGSSPGARVPESGGFQTRFLKNELGRDVVSRLNEHVLQQIAASGHGFYAPLGTDGDGLVSIANQGVAPLAKGTQIRQSKELREYFQWPLGLAFALLLLEMTLSERKNGKGLAHV
jgi:Ca-activated chloride channel family protein